MQNPAKSLAILLLVIVAVALAACNNSSDDGRITALEEGLSRAEAQERKSREAAADEREEIAERLSALERAEAGRNTNEEMNAETRSLVMSLLTGMPGGSGEEEEPTIIFSDLNWDSAQIQNAIAARIVSAWYGYPTDKVFGGTVPLMEALTRGDTNVTLEIWLPNQKEAYDQAIAEGTIEVVGNSLEDNWQSAFIVPKYVTDANPGLRTVQDLRDHMDLFVTPDSNGKARLLNCPPGWECEVTNTKQVAGYGLDDVIELVNPGSGEALEAEIRASFEKEEPVLFYYWGPTTLSNALSSEYGGYTLLEEPPYTAECWDAERNCGYSIAQVLIVMRKDLIDQVPDLVTFFEKWDFSAANQLEAEGYLGELDGNFSAAADKFLQNNSAWKNWVTSDAASKVEAAVGS